MTETAQAQTNNKQRTKQIATKYEASAVSTAPLHSHKSITMKVNEIKAKRVSLK
jgi:hypothetical protein